MAIVPEPMAGDPDVLVRGTFNDDFGPGWWRRFGDVNLGGSCGLGRFFLPVAGAKSIAVITGFPVWLDIVGVERGRFDPATGSPNIGTVAPAPGARNPFSSGEGFGGDCLGARWWWRLAYDDVVRVRGCGWCGRGVVRVLPAAFDEHIVVAVPVPA